MVGAPEVEILEGPPGLTLSIKQGMVLPRRLNCAEKVPGGVLVATAKDITDPVQGRLVYRIKYKTKDGDRQTSNSYNVSLFPDESMSGVAPMSTNATAPEPSGQAISSPSPPE